MKETLAALAFGLGISAPASLDALTFVPCTAKVITIKEHPTLPVKRIPENWGRESLSLYDKYIYGVRYSLSVGYEESICAALPPDEIPLVRFNRVL